MQDKKPLYQQLYESLRADVVAGRLKEGEKLPSKRVLAERKGVSVITVENAYAMLEDEGYITAKQRSGFFVGAPMGERLSGERGQAPALSKENGDGADVDFRFSSLSRIMRKVITEYDRALLLKPPAFGCQALRKALSDYLYRYRGIEASPDNILIGSGSEYFYGMIVALLGRDRVYGLEYPSYEKIGTVIRANGGRVEYLTMGEKGILSDELGKTNADVLHVTPFNSFPTGVTANHAKRTEYVAWARKRGGYIVEDDIDSEFAVGVKPVQTVFSLDGGKRVIYLNTFSRSMAPSMRLGYMILPDELKRRYQEKLGFYSCPVPAFDQYVMAEFIAEGHFERHLNRIRRKLREQRKK